RTFVLLLLTDLRNDEIVLGKLLGSLLQIGLFLTGSIPVLFILVLLGGVDPRQVLGAALVLSTTALAAGSLGALVALWRDKTFQALALTVLCLVLYLCFVQALGLAPLLRGVLPESVDVGAFANVQAWLDPFLALHRVLVPPDVETAV